LALGKSEIRTIKSSKDLEASYEVCKKICIDGKLNSKTDEKTEKGFELHFSEPMKWLSTNYPNNLKLIGEVFEGSVVIRLEAYSNGVSITQGTNTANFLENYASSLNAYLGGE